MPAFTVWLSTQQESDAISVITDAFESAASHAGEDLVSAGAASVYGDGTNFDLIVRDDAGDVKRFRAQPPPAFVLEDVDCCRTCGVSEDDDDAPGWADDDLCVVCAEAMP